MSGVVCVDELFISGLSTSRMAFSAHLLVDVEQLAVQGWTRDWLLAHTCGRLVLMGSCAFTIELVAR